MIECEHLAKTYPGKKPVTALSDVSFSVAAGEAVALLGVNGAGKTTTLRILSTMIKPTGGRATLDGLDVVANPREVRQRIGFLSSGTGIYGRLSGRESLRYFGALYGLSRAQIDQRLAWANDRLKLSDYWDRTADGYSTGQKQRLSIARAVLHDPPILFFDEPTSGLDVIAAQSVLEFLEESRSQQKTLVFSTHVMSEVARICPRTIVLGDGRVVFDGPTAALQEGQTMEQGFLKAVGYERGGGRS